MKLQLSIEISNTERIYPSEIPKENHLSFLVLKPFKPPFDSNNE
jgi:hypothetical protein